jgi:superfamily I DNA and RNA helicase
MFDHPHLWEEIGYRRRAGELRDGHDVSLYRPEETSPAFLENHSPLDDLVQFHRFDDDSQQAEWVANAIRKNLDDDELRADDIVVINPNPLSTRGHVGPIRSRLLDYQILSHTAGVDTDPDVFYRTEAESITFTGIYRAKGNEAAMVYIIHADECNTSTWNLATLRNRLFTAITRSKGWVRILGVGEGMQAIIEEFEAVKRANFELNFRYPTPLERKALKIVHRDVSTGEKKRFETRQQGLLDWINEVESGNLHFEDLDEDAKRKLQALMNRKA